MAMLRISNAKEILRAAAKRIADRVIKEEAEKAANDLVQNVKIRLIEELAVLTVDVVENINSASLRPELVIVVNDKKESA